MVSEIKRISKTTNYLFALLLVSLLISYVLIANAATSLLRSCIVVSGLTPDKVFQEYGSYQCGRSVEGLPVLVKGKLYTDVIGTHARSEIYFHNTSFKKLKFLAALPDYLRGRRGSVIFSVLADGVVQWKSPVIYPGRLVRAEVSIEGYSEIVLVTSDAGDGNSNDHACWINLSFTQ